MFNLYLQQSILGVLEFTSILKDLGSYPRLLLQPTQEN